MRLIAAVMGSRRLQLISLAASVFSSFYPKKRRVCKVVVRQRRNWRELRADNGQPTEECIRSNERFKSNSIKLVLGELR
jgi:hypothetical protein